VSAKIDLTPTTLSFDFLAWSKAAGTTGQAEALLLLPKGQPPVLKNFSISAPDLAANGHGSLTMPSAWGRWRSITCRWARPT